jgi:hypothetical protein
MRHQRGKQKPLLALPVTTQITGSAVLIVIAFVLLWFSLRSTPILASASTLWQGAAMNTGMASHTPASVPTKPTNTVFDASKQLVRLAQMNPAQYASQAEYNTWAASACSTTSMTEVLDAYGHHYRITDILQVEARIGAITPALGLTTEAGVAQTVAQFGFQTSWGHSRTLDQIIAAANNGAPVIVSFPPGTSTLFAPGHILVVIGGNASRVNLADSSNLNLTSLSRQQFLNYWRGFSAIVTPKGAQQ